MLLNGSDWTPKVTDELGCEKFTRMLSPEMNSYDLGTRTGHRANGMRQSPGPSTLGLERNHAGGGKAVLGKAGSQAPLRTNGFYGS